MNMPLIVYFQTITECNGHCSYCPFDDVYGDQPVQKMSYQAHKAVLDWLKSQNYKGRIGYLLHYEPTMDKRMPAFVKQARMTLPGVRLEAATNGLIDSPALELFDVVDKVAAGERTVCTSRAGNCRATPETTQKRKLMPGPCRAPLNMMCIAANGDVLLCCQDWRHEAVVGNIDDLTAARARQLELMPKVEKAELEICADCQAGKTAEEVGERLGERTI